MKLKMSLATLAPGTYVVSPFCGVEMDRTSIQPAAGFLCRYGLTSPGLWF
jgi:hypothetical protein